MGGNLHGVPGKLLSIQVQISIQYVMHYDCNHNTVLVPYKYTIMHKDITTVGI